MKTKAKSPKTKRFSSLHDVYTRAKAGEEMAQLCIIGSLSNTGCDHLMPNPRRRPWEALPLWNRAWQGIQEYISALVGEYGMSESKAEKEFLAELNMARSYMEGREAELKEWAVVDCGAEPLAIRELPILDLKPHQKILKVFQTEALAQEHLASIITDRN